MKSPKFFLNGLRLHRGIAMGAIAAAAAIVLSQNTASAALQLVLSDGTPADTVTIVDGGAGDSSGGAIPNGTIINTSNLNGFGVAITVTQSNSPGSTSAGSLQVTSLDIKNGTGSFGTLTIQASDTNYTGPTGPGLTLTSLIGGTLTGVVSGDSVSFKSFADAANGQPASAVSTPLLTLTGSSFSGNNAVPFTRGGGPYSLSSTAMITLASGDQANIAGSTTTTPVPEPATLGLGAVAAIGLLSRRRRAVI